MATLTIRSVPPRIVRSLKKMARQNRRSMEREVRELLEERFADRSAILQKIEASWSMQPRRPTPKQLDQWIQAGRR